MTVRELIKYLTAMPNQDAIVVYMDIGCGCCSTGAQILNEDSISVTNNQVKDRFYKELDSEPDDTVLVKLGY